MEGSLSSLSTAGVGKPSDSFWTVARSGVRFLKLIGQQSCGVIAWRGSTFCGVGDDNRVGQSLTCAPPSRALEIRCTAMTLLQSGPIKRDRFVSHLYQSRRDQRRTRETAGKSGKQIERCAISAFQVVESSCQNCHLTSSFGV